MSINNKVTFRRKHRPVWYGMLCLVLITAAVSTMSLIPAQSNDLSSAESEGNYTLTDGKNIIDSDGKLESIIEIINDSKEGSVFTIIVNGNDTNFPGFELNPGKGTEVTLTSSSDKPFTLTITEEDVRHFTVVSGTLALENIILDSSWVEERYWVEGYKILNYWEEVIKSVESHWEEGYAGGGVEVCASGTLIMNKGAVIQNSFSLEVGGGIKVQALGKLIMNKGAVIQNSFSLEVGGGIGVEKDGTLVMNDGGVIQNCSASSHGGGVYNSGTFTMNGGVIANNTAEMGGGVYNDKGTFTMVGGIIKINEAIYRAEVSYTTGNGGGVYNEGGSFTMKGGEISVNTSYYYGGGVYNDGSGAKFEMYGGKIIGNWNQYSNCGGVYNDEGRFEMHDGEISGNIGSSDGGGLFCTGDFFMFGGKISGNKARSEGGGLYKRAGIFEMHDGEISGNTADQGGGVKIDRYANFTMKGGEISGNKSNWAGGVLSDGSTFTLEKGKISGNTATKWGGGVYNYGGSFTMTDGEISGNTADLGGGVYNRSNSTFEMKDGTISGNTANFGGGVYNERSTFTMTGGTISGNTATSADHRGSGGGIYTDNFANLTVAKGVVFSGNTAPTLRTLNIDGNADIDGNKVSDLTEYDVKIGAVALSAPADPKLNAPAYNNFDINYPGDTYIIAIATNPNGGGTVTATYNGNDTVYTKGHVFIPLSGGMITLSATPKSGYEFKQFIIDGSKVKVDSVAFDVSGYTAVVAEFSLISTQPEQKDNIITATAESGSEITPSGAVKVPYGESKTFTFSAKPGYKITAVFVDGLPISSAELASGEYTFRDVKSDHEINVVSEANDGSDVGAGGNDMGAGGSGGWIVLGMVCVMLLIFSGAVVLIARKDHLRTGSGPEQP